MRSGKVCQYSLANAGKERDLDTLSIDGKGEESGVLGTRMPRRRFHLIVFLIAGFYNIGWGLFSAAQPQWLFRFAHMAPINYPQIFACLGMVVGVYGILYWEVARRPEHGWLIAAVGMLGKVLGPLGLAQLIFTHQWPLATIALCVTNDFLWWIPFGLYLYDAWPWFRATLLKMGAGR
jgi:hypothetical protein